MRTHSIFTLTAALAITAAVTLTGCSNTEQTSQADTSPDPVDAMWEPVSTEPDDDTGADLAAEAKQDQPATVITQPGPNGSITVTLPDGWEYRVCDVGDSELINGDYGLHLYPAGQEGFIEIAYTEQFGVCGMGLEEEKRTIAGIECTVGYFDGDPIWSFVVFGEGHDGIVANTVLVSDWWNLEAQSGEDSMTYGEQAWQILDTLQYDPDNCTDDQSQPL